MTATVGTAAPPGDEQRPRRGPLAAEAEVDLENVVFVTHAVPAARVRSLLPPGLALETFEGEDGRETALVTTTCFCNRDVRWRLTRRPTHTFNQITFRTYVTHGDDRGLYFFGDYVDTLSSWAVQGMLAKGTKLAKFDLDIERDGRGYARYSCAARSGAEAIRFVAETSGEPPAVHPFTTGRQHDQFITFRLHGFARNPFGLHSHGRVDHRRFRTLSGRLLEGRFDFWENLGILEPGETLPAYSVLTEPHIRFILMPPRPVRL
ncbi:MAG: DUF2071 domain-containing protein [Actinomycetota bacterium]|nr:DUF2071 domain-containing protein [Actinomycetota bacterium]